ncbi:MAG: glycosyltransferase family 2 protein [Termitinemataceae bacterium]|nr:MAG: glycosyltransferase family 2 protein [Termitinemataceae bacterium]
MKVSIVVPALNEELTIGEFVSWCKEGLSKIEGGGEIIIVDSSTDRTPEIAVMGGARVVRVPKRGLGRAYIDALPEIRGDYVIMGDCDLTYDFREIDKFVEKLDEGYEFVMGTRMSGYIEDGAMPKLHRYFGTPLTTWILNSIYGSNYSDIHCGMRAMTLDALKRINLESQSWEYASEMVLKAAKLKLKTAEVPIRFYKDREGRVSQHKRAGWFSPWLAGWLNLKVMFEYNPSFFLKWPGRISMALGILVLLLVIGGMFIPGLAMFAITWLIASILLIVTGYSSWQLSALSETYYGYDRIKRQRFKDYYTYNRGVLCGSALMLIGIAVLLGFGIYYVRSNFILRKAHYAPLFGTLLTITGFQTFTFTLLLRMLFKRRHIGDE